MADDNGVWVDELPERKRKTRWSMVVDDLKANPGKWKMFEVNNAQSTMQHLKRTYPGVEATSYEDRELYVRWPK